MRRFLGSLLLIGAAGCADRVAAPVSDNFIGGFWSLTAAGPGSSTTMQLSLGANGAVTGTGQWRGEAGPYGPLAASGTIRGGRVELDLVYSYDPIFVGVQPRTAHFSGWLRSETELSGSFGPISDLQTYAAFTKFFPPN